MVFRFFLVQKQHLLKVLNSHEMDRNMVHPITRKEENVIRCDDETSVRCGNIIVIFFFPGRENFVDDCIRISSLT